MINWKLSRYFTYLRGNWKLVWNLRKQLGFIRTAKEIVLALSRAYHLMMVDYDYFFKYPQSTRSKLSDSLIIVR